MSSPEHVILLHGLCRTARSMRHMAFALQDAGFIVHNIGYPSRTAGISTLADQAVGDSVQACRQAGAGVIHFVTHSLGGILVRSYLQRHRLPELGRVVMIAPPNQGSEVVDKLRRWKILRWLNGPAVLELGTDPAATPIRLGSADFPLGILAGDRSINWINSTFIPGPDDGKVSVARTRLEGMTDHRVLHTPHPFIMRNREAIRQTLAFLRTGKFS